MSEEARNLPPTTITYDSTCGLTRVGGSSLPPGVSGIGARVPPYVYQDIPSVPAFAFAHDAAQGVFRLRWPNGTVEVFRDRPARYLCVEPDEAGVMRPVVRNGQPVFLYLAREEREVR